MQRKTLVIGAAALAALVVLVLVVVVMRSSPSSSRALAGARVPATPSASKAHGGSPQGHHHTLAAQARSRSSGHGASAVRLPSANAAAFGAAPSANAAGTSASGGTGSAASGPAGAASAGGTGAKAGAATGVSSTPPAIPPTFTPTQVNGGASGDGGSLVAWNPSTGAPLLPVGSKSTGSCTGPSQIALGAVQCTDAAAVHFQACYPSATGLTALCLTAPWTPATQVSLTSPISPSSGFQASGTRPWALVLDNGAHCLEIVGAASVQNGVAFNYSCQGGTAGGLSGSTVSWLPSGGSAMQSVGVAQSWR